MRGGAGGYQVKMKRKDVTKLIRGSFSYGVAILGILREGRRGSIKCVSAPLVIPDSVGRLGEVTLNGFEQVAVSWGRKNLGTNHTELDQLEARINIHHC